MSARIWAGVPQSDAALYWKIGLPVGDPVAFLELPDGRKVCIVRDVELDRAREVVRADVIGAPAMFEPAGGFLADREVGTAQAAAECLRREGISTVKGHRSLPLTFAKVLGDAGIEVECDLEMGVLERRQKTEEEIEKTLTRDGIELLAGDVVTIEPGLYEVGFGGARVEDMVVVTESGIENLNRLPEGLDWR